MYSMLSIAYLYITLHCINTIQPPHYTHTLFILYTGVQYHPELKSRPNRPSPPLYSFASVVCAHLTTPETPIRYVYYVCVVVCAVLYCDIFV